VIVFGLGGEVGGLFDGFDHGSDLEWFFEKGVETSGAEALGLAVG